ncbi:MAG: BACON domain-containing protein [Candidatus Cryptobacteroides sp.]
MKLKHLLFGILAVGLLAVGCEDPEKGSPRVEIKGTENGVLTFAKEEGTQTITMRANRDWRVSFNPATANEWINMQTSGEVTGEDGITLPISVSANTGFSREATVTFRAGTAKKTITVKQEGEGGSEDDATVYFNNFDKEEVTKTYGTNGSSFPYLDQFEGWHNEKGTGIANVSYDSKTVSIRNSGSGSNSNYSDYAGSGVNHVFFGANNYMVVKNIALGDATTYTLSLGTEKYDGNNKEAAFSKSEFHVYLSDQDKLAEKRWVELAYEYPETAGRWNLATATVTVPAGTKTLSIYVNADVASVYRLDDLKLVEASAAGTAIDFANGKAVGTDQGGSTGGDDNFGEAKGSGTEADPFNVAAAHAKALENTFTPPADNDKINALPEYYVKGKISSIKSVDTGQYGNAEYYISDDGTTTAQLLIYRGYFLDGAKFTSSDQIKVGDEVVVKGRLFNAFGNTPEMSNGNSIVSLNGASEDNTKRLSVSTKTLNVSAESMSATFKVGGNVAWTASVTEGAGFVKILSGESGEGAGDVVLELTQNTTDADRTAKITVTTTEDIAEKSIEVVLTQKKKLAEGEANYNSNVTWTANQSSKSYNEKVKIGGAEYPCLKLGSSSAVGSATMTIPAGTSKVEFYGVAWNNKDGEVVISVGSNEIYRQSFARNAGIANSSPYTITVADTDFYTLDVTSMNGGKALDADTEITLSTVTGKTRVVIFGVNAK